MAGRKIINHCGLAALEIENEHRALLRVAEDLRNEITKGMETKRLDSVFARLTSYARFHFENEEALMRRTRYPGYEEHRREHDTFVARVASLEGLFEIGEAKVPEALEEFLRTWLEQHMAGPDRRLAEYISGL